MLHYYRKLNNIEEIIYKYINKSTHAIRPLFFGINVCEIDSLLAMYGPGEKIALIIINILLSLAFWL